MLKAKSGMTRAERKSIRRVNELRMDLEACNQKALIHGFHTVKEQYQKIKKELSEAEKIKKNILAKQTA